MTEGITEAIKLKSVLLFNNLINDEMVLRKLFESVPSLIVTYYDAIYKVNCTKRSSRSVKTFRRIIMNVTSVDFLVCFPELWPLPPPADRTGLICQTGLMWKVIPIKFMENQYKHERGVNFPLLRDQNKKT